MSNGLIPDQVRHSVMGLNCKVYQQMTKVASMGGGGGGVH